MNDPDPGLRGAAASALRRVDSPAAGDVLTSAYAAEADVGVRMAIITSLAETPGGDAAVPWALRELQHTTDARRRKAWSACWANGGGATPMSSPPCVPSWPPTP